MVSVSTIKNDSADIQDMFTSYSSCIDSLKDSNIWSGKSQQNYIEQAEKFVREFVNPMKSQMSVFADSIANLQDYNNLKTQLSIADSNYQRALRADDRTLMSRYQSQKMNTLKLKIKSQINEVASYKVNTNPAEDFQVKDFRLNKFIYFRQGDYGQAYAGETIAAAGCGPTSAAMVLSYLTGQEVTPPEACAYSTQHGFATNGNGTYEALFPSIGKAYGLTVKQESQTATNIINSLSQGNVIIAHMGPGEFTRGGHYIVLRETDGKGNVLVADPANPNRNKWYPASIFEAQRRGSMYSFNV